MLKQRVLHPQCSNLIPVENWGFVVVAIVFFRKKGVGILFKKVVFNEFLIK